MAMINGIALKDLVGKIKFETFKKPLLANKSLARMERVLLEDIRIDPRFQREPIHDHLQKIFENFDPRLAAGLVGARIKGTKHVWLYDSMHRAIVIYALKNDLNITGFDIHVIDLNDEKELADLLLKVNKNRRPISGYDTHKIKVEYGDPNAVSLQKIFDKLGIQLCPSKSNYIKHPAKRCNEISRINDGYNYVNDPIVFEEIMAMLVLKFPTSWIDGDLIKHLGYFYDHNSRFLNSNKQKSWSWSKIGDLLSKHPTMSDFMEYAFHTMITDPIFKGKKQSEFNERYINEFLIRQFNLK